MDTIGSDPIDGTEADVADLLDQAEPPTSEPIAAALEERERIVATDPELTGLEAEEAEDSGQA
ncbi:hypothetical protein [Amnibacterium kyonggiense]|uniref:Uncharacterized protein n=1 Tax=Amnibacterium kyonggiense TaxID=595671 RepID=A0A4R7FL59_9MICO|nr:hypothetical protein [Amnibacterium kyonggiense]TDS77097.1 hypothetical protein CLV52_2037 [Amnibacterium kyonggiense]